MGLLDAATKAAKDKVFGPGSNNVGGSNNSGSNNVNNNNSNKDSGFMSSNNNNGGGSKNRNDGTAGTDKRIACATCWIVVSFIIIFVAIIIGLATPLWLSGSFSASGSSTVKLNVGLTQAVSTGGSGGTVTTKLSDSQKCSADYCKAWRRAGRLTQVILIITIIAAIIAAMIACCFCGGDSVFECIGGCIPCCAPGAGSPIPIPSFLPCAETAAVAGPRYLTLFASACCDIVLIILLLVAALTYNVATKGNRTVAVGFELKLALAFYFCLIGAFFALVNLCIHGCLIFIYPALIATEMAGETAGVAGSGVTGAAKGVANMF
eukprot:Amastigsp_a174817_690.p1 type:complete len:321 gc:universal Amastigsp_a174817_690:990-28(-)